VITARIPINFSIFFLFFILFLLNINSSEIELQLTLMLQNFFSVWLRLVWVSISKLNAEI